MTEPAIDLSFTMLFRRDSNLFRLTTKAVRFLVPTFRSVQTWTFFGQSFIPSKNLVALSV